MLSTGAFIVYASVAGRNPLRAFIGVLNGEPVREPSPAGSGGPGGIFGFTGSSTGASGGSSPATSVPVGDRPALLKARKIVPDLVAINEKGWKLDTSAAQSFAAVQADLGRPIVLSGNPYRSYAEQLVLWQREPGRFGNPAHSLHVVGLAVDVSTDGGQAADPALVSAFERHGWYRQGAKINGVPEPWHWSYGVPG